MAISSTSNEIESARCAFAKRVLAELDGRGSGTGWPVVPYPGVRSFTAEEETIFFGREDDILKVREKLTQQRCVFVLGGSGSGKSSLVRAGVMPKLIAGDPLNARWGPWYSLTFTPGQKPFESLARALISDIYGISEWPRATEDATRSTATVTVRRKLATEKSLARISRKAASDARPSEARSKADLEERLTAFLIRRYQHDGEGLATFLYAEIDRFHCDFAGDEPIGRTNLIVLVDQFEELFRYGVDTTSAYAIVRLMAKLASLDHLPGLYVVATMRSEEVYRSVDYPELTALINRTAHFVDLPNANDLFESIRTSASTVLRLAEFDESNEGIKAEVVERMLDAVGALAPERAQRADQLPLLQNALRELWGHAAIRWSADPTLPLTITFEDLNKLPVITNTDVPDLGVCLDNTANAAYREARDAFGAASGDHDWNELLEVAFVRLEQLDDRGNSARAFATIDDMLSASGRSWPDGEARLQRALAVFVRRTLLARRDTNKGVRFDVSHEAVLRNWTTYRRWLANANLVRRAIGRVLEDTWDARPGAKPRTRFDRIKRQLTKWMEELVKPGPSVGDLVPNPVVVPRRAIPNRRAERPTRAERGDWTPELSTRQSGNLVSADQSKILQSIRPKQEFSFSRRLRLFWRHPKDFISSLWRRRALIPHLLLHRKPPKFSRGWVTETIVPMLERRRKANTKIASVAAAEESYIREKAGSVTGWLGRTIDRARRQHWMNWGQTLGGAGAAIGLLIAAPAYWILLQGTYPADLRERSTRILLSSDYWQTAERSKYDEDVVNLISTLRTASSSINSLLFSPTWNNVDGYFTAISNMDIIVRNRLHSALEYSEVENSKVGELPEAVCKYLEKVSVDSAAPFTLLVKPDRNGWGVGQVVTKDNSAQFVPVVERGKGNFFAAGTGREVFSPPPGIWCLSSTGDALLIWQYGLLPYVLQLQWASYSTASGEVRWLAKVADTPQKTTLPTDLHERDRITRRLTELYSKLIAAPSVLSKSIRERNSTRAGFVIVDSAGSSIELSFQPALRHPQRRSQSEWPSDLKWQTCRPSQKNPGIECDVGAFEKHETDIRYRVQLIQTNIEDLLVDVRGGPGEPIPPCSSDKPGGGVCRYDLKVDFRLGETPRAITRFGYSGLYSRPISGVAIYENYLWLRLGESGDAVRFDFSSQRALDAMKALPRDKPSRPAP